MRLHVLLYTSSPSKYALFLQTLPHVVSSIGRPLGKLGPYSKVLYLYLGTSNMASGGADGADGGTSPQPRLPYPAVNERLRSVAHAT